MADLTKQLESQIILSVCGLGGEALFREIVRRLAERTASPYAFILTPDRPGGSSARLLAAWNAGYLEQGVTFDLPGTPSERVLSRAAATVVRLPATALSVRSTGGPARRHGVLGMPHRFE